MTHPMLFLPFEDSLAGRDADGAVTPTSAGTVAYDNGMVAGTRAYRAAQDTGASLTLTNDNYLATTAGEVVVRFRPSDTFDGANQYVFANSGFTSDNRLYLRRNATNDRLYGSFGALDNLVNNTASGVVADNTWTTASLAWEDGDAALYLNDPGTPAATVTSVTISDFGTGIVMGRSPTSSAQYTNGLIDDVVIYGRKLTPSERSRLFDTDTPWSWDLLARRRVDTLLTPGPRPITMLTPH